MKRLVILTAVITAMVLFLGAQTPADTLAGTWEGSISVMGTELAAVVHFENGPDGLKAAIDIPQQRAMGLALQNVRAEGDKVHFELAAGPSTAVFEGTRRDSVIEGDFTQSGVKGAFKLTKKTAVAAVAAPAPEKKAVEPLPYKEEEVVVPSGPIKLAGTLTIPAGKGPFPAVIMITGSGAQNRDEELFGFKPFRTIADYLTRRGIAVLRCDDRGIGGSQGSTAQSTTLDLAGDAAAQGAFLKSRSDIDAGAIGLIGHSEGGIIAPLAAGKGGFAFIVMLAGPSVKGEDVILEQLRLITTADGLPAEEVKAALAAQKKLFAILGTPNEEKDLELYLSEESRKSLEKMTPEQKKSITDPEKFIKNAVAGQMASLRSPWFRYFVSYDPAPALKQVKCPVLAVYGEKDLQVPPAQSVPVLQDIFRKSGNRDVTVKVLPEANHLFLKAKTGSPTEYAKLDKTFVPGFLDTISGWVLKKAGRA